MKSSLKNCLLIVTYSFFLTGMMGTTYGQVMYVPETAFNEARSLREYDPRSGDDTSESVLSDEELENRMERLLARSPFVNGNITIQVDYGTAVLSGSVQDRDAMTNAVDIAYDYGATNVNNHQHMRDHLTIYGEK